MKSIFSKWFNLKRFLKPKHYTSHSPDFPGELSSKYELFQHLDFTVPEMQTVKLSLEREKQEKAFEQFFRYMKTRHSPVLPCNWWKRETTIEALTQHYPELKLKLLQAADQILQHRFLLFARHPIHTGPDILWSASYERGGSPQHEGWEPGRPYTISHLLTDPQRNIYFIWELNRHQHFLDLGKAYWYTGQVCYLQEFMREITDWNAQNPYPLSVNWTNPYEIAIRGVFWMLGYGFFFFTPSIDDEFFCNFYQALLFHGHAVSDALQHGAMVQRATHNVALAAFLYLFGTLFPEYRYSKSWSKQGWEILQWKTEHLTREALIEDSLASLITAIELYCLILLCRQKNRVYIPRHVTNGVTMLLEHLALFLRPNGRLAAFGEEPPRQLLTGMYQQSQDFRYLFAFAAHLLQDERFKTLGKTCGEPLLWFVGQDGLRDFEALGSSTYPQRSHLSPDSSYAMMRSGWEEESGYFVIANGTKHSRNEQGFRHSDLLSFELVINGLEYLIDSGPYSYGKDDWNRYFHSLQAHNSITVDRLKQLNFSNHTIEGEFDRWVSTSHFDFLSGYHTGFEELDDPIQHRRSVFYAKPNYWILSDLLTGEGQHFFDQFFHFPPARLHVDFMNKRVALQPDTGQHFILMPISPNEMDVSIFTGGEHPDSGWVSDGYRHRVEAPYIKYSKQAIAPTSFHTLLYAYSGRQVHDIAGRHLHASSHDESLLSDQISAIEIRIEDEKHYFALLHRPHELVEFEQITFTGELLFLKTKEEQVQEIMLHHATYLKMRETVLFEADAPVEGLVLRLNDNTLSVFCSGHDIFRMQLPHIEHLFVNNRKAFLKHENDTILISTTRI